MGFLKNWTKVENVISRFLDFCTHDYKLIFFLYTSLQWNYTPLFNCDGWLNDLCWFDIIYAAVTIYLSDIIISTLTLWCRFVWFAIFSSLMRLTKFLLNRFLMCVNEEKPSFVNCQRLATFFYRVYLIYIWQNKMVWLFQIVSDVVQQGNYMKLHFYILIKYSFIRIVEGVWSHCITSLYSKVRSSPFIVPYFCGYVSSPPRCAVSF